MWESEVINQYEDMGCVRVCVIQKKDIGGYAYIYLKDHFGVVETCPGPRSSAVQSQLEAVKTSLANLSAPKAFSNLNLWSPARYRVYRNGLLSEEEEIQECAARFPLIFHAVRDREMEFADSNPWTKSRMGIMCVRRPQLVWFLSIWYEGH